MDHSNHIIDGICFYRTRQYCVDIIIGPLWGGEFSRGGFACRLKSEKFALELGIER